MTRAPDPAVRKAVSRDRQRCALLVQEIIGKLDDPGAPPTVHLLKTLARHIKIGKNPPRPRLRKRGTRTCNYCLGEEGPERHNRATCPKRFRELAAGIVVEKGQVA